MNNKAQNIVEAAIDEVNDDADVDSVIAKDPSTSLFGPESIIDSLTLVRLLVTVERLIEDRTGKSVVVVDESAFESEISPFSSVRTLTDHVAKLIA